LASVPDQAAIDRLTYINHDGYLIGGITWFVSPCRAGRRSPSQFDRPPLVEAG
jgi:hypothetical protein